MRRRLLIAAVLFLAGAVVNVAVAWGCCLLPAGRVELLTTASATALLKGHLPAIRIGPPVQGISRRGLGWQSHTAIDEQYNSVGLRQAGWPTSTLEGHRAGTQYRLVAESGLWYTDRRVSTRPIILPLQPIWPGFAVNTIFYAAVLWLLICGPFVLRRFIRVKRGLCPACAYPRGESAVCSECGRAFPQAVKVTT